MFKNYPLNLGVFENIWKWDLVIHPRMVFGTVEMAWRSILLSFSLLNIIK